ncbi:MAG: hypothetical protein ABW168_07375 [Sedimenticola sp.]
MAPLFIGLVSAMLFGLTAHGVYGTEGILTESWVDMVFWALIGTGTLISFVKVFWECLPCMAFKLIHIDLLSRFFCHDVPCSE